MLCTVVSEIQDGFSVGPFHLAASMGVIGGFRQVITFEARSYGYKDFQEDLHSAIGQ